MRRIPCNICGSQENTQIFLTRDLYTNKDDPTQFALAHCNRCGFAYLNPQPSYQELTPFYQHGYFNSFTQEKKRSGLYLFLRKARRNMFPEFSLCFYRWDLGSRKSHAKFLDVGCAVGAKDRKFINDFPAWEFFGVEPDKEAARVAASVRGLTVFPGFLKDAKYPDNSFDIVLFHHVLEHSLDPQADVKESYRILKPGGKLVIVVPNYGCPAARIFGKYWRHLDIPRHLFHFREKDLRKLLADIGFDVKKTESETMQASILDSFLNSVGVKKNFSDNFFVILLRFSLVPISRIGELCGFGSALSLLAIKREH